MKITKATNRIFALLLSLALMLTAAPVFAGSDDAEVSDTRELPTGLYVEEEPEIVLPEITDTPGEEIPVKAPPRLRKSGDVVAEGVDKWFSYTLLRNDDGEDTYTIILSPGTSSSTDTPYIYFNKSDIYNEYKQRLCVVGKDIDVINIDYTKRATVLSLNKDFSLNVQYENGERETISSGEISTHFV